MEKESQGAIVFTSAAHQSWKRDAYPRVDVMDHALVTLTKAAIEYRPPRLSTRDASERMGQGRVGLNMASTDKYMSTNGLDTFAFEGGTYSRLAHLKLGDHTSPNEVGRVCFAMDSNGERVVVDHVGLKPYGL